MTEETPAVQRPKLVQIGNISVRHLNDFKIWASCHSFDYDQEWYDDTDEDTFRPWDGPLPVDPLKGMFLVKSLMTLSNDETLEGFLTPQRTSEPENLGIIQPHIFLTDGRAVGFWSGLMGWHPEHKRKFYELIGRTAAEVFPIHFKALEGLALGRVEGLIQGFYTRSKVHGLQVER